MDKVQVRFFLLYTSLFHFKLLNYMMCSKHSGEKNEDSYKQNLN